MISELLIKQFVRERDEAAKSYDVKRFRTFYRKWADMGFYHLLLPEDDYILAITMRKMVCMMESATPEEKAEAKEWLERRGYTEF